MGDFVGLEYLNFDELADELRASCDTVEKIKQELRRRAKAEIARLEARKAELTAFVSDEDTGVDPDEFVGTIKAAKLGPPKYRHPFEDSITWTGRGKKPHWMRDWIQAGKDPNDLLIDCNRRLADSINSQAIENDPLDA